MNAKTPPVKVMIKKVAGLIITENYSELIRLGLLTEEIASDVQSSVTSYGRTLVELPDEAFEKAFEYELENGRWRIEIQLWTKEEGESDLTLALEVLNDDDGNVLTIRILQVHVL